jgi:excisionase family DNA binding protein
MATIVICNGLVESRKIQRWIPCFALMRTCAGRGKNRRTRSPTRNRAESRLPHGDSSLENQPIFHRGNAPFNAPFNILTALYSLTGTLSVEEVAEMFGKSPDKVYRMAQKHQIPSFMFGGSRCFDPSALAHWLIKKEPQLAVAARYFQKAA